MSQIEVSPSSFALLNSDAYPSKIPRVKDMALDFSKLEREPGLRKQIYEHPVNMHGEIQRSYIKLALVPAAREVVKAHQFFKDLSDIVNIASASSKRHDELQKAQAVEITRLVSIKS
ncbi:hypothetical protein PVK06_030499 [Gossypium arboreum]|uniref:Uncharacterized protein n=1 Tax=Gossypium arboreum TaxID=29729 RepID=A0ABR0NPI1_GOSAR|nr:hypothetical protein PVK06_030499 [Gossypium arboreum]